VGGADRQIKQVALHHRDRPPFDVLKARSFADIIDFHKNVIMLLERERFPHPIDVDWKLRREIVASVVRFNDSFGLQLRRLPLRFPMPYRRELSFRNDRINPIL